MATTKGVRKYAMVALMMAFMVSACHQKEVLKREVVHDTVFVDNSLKKKVDTVFYDSKRLRNRFERPNGRNGETIRIALRWNILNL